MTKIHRITLFIIVLVGIFSCSDGHTAPILVKLGTALPPDHPTSKSLRFFRDEIEQSREGQMSIQIFPDTQLGTAYEILDGLQFGNIEMGVLSSELLARRFPLLATVSMPYIFRDEEHLFRVLDGPVGMQFLNSLEQRNLIGLGFLDTSMRNLLTRQDHIRNPEELKGQKIGIIRKCSRQDCQSTITRIVEYSLSALESSPELIDPQDAYTSLQSDTIFGLECSIAEILSLKLYETGATYFTSGMYYAIPDVLVASKRWFDTLSPEMQHTLRNASRKTVWQQRKLWAEKVQGAISKLEAEGVTFETSNPELFRKAVQPVYTKMYEEFGPEFEELIQAIMAVK